MTAQAAKDLGEFLAAVTQATVDTGWQLGANFAVELAAPDGNGSIRIRWDDEEPGYIVDDEVGS
jgi:hypothetical protein